MGGYGNIWEDMGGYGFLLCLQLPVCRVNDALIALFATNEVKRNKERS